MRQPTLCEIYRKKQEKKTELQRDVLICSSARQGKPSLLKPILILSYGTELRDPHMLMDAT